MVARKSGSGRKPSAVRVHPYQVGFGDCFLVEFVYAKSSKFILVDFGSTGAPRGAKPDFLANVAADIAATCGGSLEAVVATHRHADHISGFTTGDGSASGDIIRSLAPKLVVQPWTEDPALAKRVVHHAASQASKAFTTRLSDIHAVADAVVHEAGQLATLGMTSNARELRFLGETNVQNSSAEQNLRTMAPKTRYVRYGDKSGLEALLPGVRVTVLGPPTLEQLGAVRNHRSDETNTFWSFRANLAKHLTGARGFEPLFPNAPQLGAENAPPWARWLIPKLQRARADELKGLVRTMDKELNNTSVILLFEIGEIALLFPGDAQIESWAYALRKESVRKRLAKVALYKVGHHGSLSATPKSLWNLFTNRSAAPGDRRLRSVMSTLPNRHGQQRTGNEVPRLALLKALQRDSELTSTHLSPSGRAIMPIEVKT
ncbi:MAG: hypothetical protein ABIT20_06290 [Gemmatimonadaceae bacterium]